VARRPSDASREKDPAAAGIRRFFSLVVVVPRRRVGVEPDTDGRGNNVTKK